MSLPANLIDLSVSNEDMSSDVVLDSSADSVDSAGFFRRFADHMTATRSRDAVYCKGVTDYSFSQSPVVENPANSISRSVLVQAGFDPADSGDECPTEELNAGVLDPTVLNDGGNDRKLPVPEIRRLANISSSVSVGASPPAAASTALGRKRWSDFGTRLVSFVDKILLPEVDRKPAVPQMPRSSQPVARRSESDERLCSLTAAHAVGRRTAGRVLSDQTDACAVIQMYSDMGKLRKDTPHHEDKISPADVTDALSNGSLSVQQASSPILR